jgi:flavin-binding protein dodecin
MAVLKVIELVGVSTEGWGAAAREAVREASKTIRHLEGLEVLRSSAVIREDTIVEYHVQVKLTFRVENSEGPLEAVEAAEAIIVEATGTEELETVRDTVERLLESDGQPGESPP